MREARLTWFIEPSRTTNRQVLSLRVWTKFRTCMFGLVSEVNIFCTSMIITSTDGQAPGKCLTNTPHVSIHSYYDQFSIIRHCFVRKKHSPQSMSQVFVFLCPRKYSWCIFIPRYFPIEFWTRWPDASVCTFSHNSVNLIRIIWAFDISKKSGQDTGYNQKDSQMLLVHLIAITKISISIGGRFIMGYFVFWQKESPRISHPELRQIADHVLSLRAFSVFLHLSVFKLRSTVSSLQELFFLLDAHIAFIFCPID